MRYLIKFSYDGTKFHGFQRQKDLRNVQSTLEDTLSKVLNQKIIIKGAGRTDAHVHALMQCAHFDTGEIPKDLLNILNKELEPDISIKSIDVVPTDFHARHSVKEKTYVYKIVNGIIKDEQIGYYTCIKKDLDIKKMQEACKIFIGSHDYQNFVSGKRDNYVSTIYDIKLTHYDNIIEIEFRGIGFYRYMVRHLVGAIIDAGKHRVELEDIKYLLDHPEYDKKLSVAKPEGLYLTNIKY